MSWRDLLLLPLPEVLETSTTLRGSDKERSRKVVTGESQELDLSPGLGGHLEPLFSV